MDPFVVVVFVGLAGVVAWLWMVGRANQRGAAQSSFGLRPARQIVEEREALEAEDLTQMLEAHNVRRRRRGEADVTALDMERRVAGDRIALQRGVVDPDGDLDELLAATNARRRSRGLPPRSRADVERELGTRATPGL